MLTNGMYQQDDCQYAQQQEEQQLLSSQLSTSSLTDANIRTTAEHEAPTELPPSHAKSLVLMAGPPWETDCDMCQTAA